VTTKTKVMCRGCHDDFYNHLEPNGCWSFSDATIVTRVRVAVWEPPPYSPNRAEECLSCYRPLGCVMLRVDDCRVRDTPFPAEGE